MQHGRRCEQPAQPRGVIADRTGRSTRASSASARVVRPRASAEPNSATPAELVVRPSPGGDLEPAARSASDPSRPRIVVPPAALKFQVSRWRRCKSQVRRRHASQAHIATPPLLGHPSLLAQTERLQQILATDPFTAGEIRDRLRHAQHPVPATRGKLPAKIRAPERRPEPHRRPGPATGSGQRRVPRYSSPSSPPGDVVDARAPPRPGHATLAESVTGAACISASDGR